MQRHALENQISLHVQALATQKKNKISLKHIETKLLYKEHNNFEARRVGKSNLHLFQRSYYLGALEC